MDSIPRLSNADDEGKDSVSATLLLAFSPIELATSEVQVCRTSHSIRSAYGVNASPCDFGYSCAPDSCDF